MIESALFAACSSRLFIVSLSPGPFTLAAAGITDGGGVVVDGVTGFSFPLGVVADAPVAALPTADAFAVVRFDDEPAAPLAARPARSCICAGIKRELSVGLTFNSTIERRRLRTTFAERPVTHLIG